MKKIIFAFIVSLTAIYAQSGVEICKESIKMAHAYKAKMGNDALSIKTMQAYKNSVVAHCGTLTAAKPTPTDALYSKQDQISTCQASISSAQIFKDQMGDSKEDKMKLQAHKCLIVQSCGTISSAPQAKPVSYCSL